MLLTAGTRLGPYEIISLVGTGGMGEVYRAHDTKLRRDVALKIVRDHVGDADRGSRFEREAHVLASLNHPHIGAIYGFEDAGDVRALVLEFVEGPTLADRIAQGPMPIAEALPVARQIADALSAAHDHGVIHRDLKPSNVKLRADGTVKVLDFGLAKVFGEDSSAALPHDSPTLSLGATRAGLILGTAAYMSPEQARAKPVDKRTDVWAFGCVLYEMLTGRRAFGGDEVSDTLAFVITKDVDWSALPHDTPAAIRRLLRRCLTKDRHQRLRDIADASLELADAVAPSSVESIRSSAVASARSPRAATLAGAAFVVGTMVSGTALFVLTRPAVEPRPVRRFTLALQTAPLAALTTSTVAISPDGATMGYIGTGSQLFLRHFNQLDATPMPNLGAISAPFFSHDGRWVGFFTGGTSELKKVSVFGGSPVVLSTYRPGASRGASWAPDDTIIFATSEVATGLLRVRGAGGGTAEVLTRPDPKQGEIDHLWPDVLPVGHAVLFTIVGPGSPTSDQLAVLDLETGARKVVVNGGTNGRYARSGHIVYGVSGTLRAVAFDPERLEVLGDPVPVLEGVVTAASGAVNAAMSRDGTLLYTPGAASGGTQRTLTWVNRQGREEPIALEPRAYEVPRLSPDNSRVVTHLEESATPDLMVSDLRRQTALRLTFSKNSSIRAAAWTRDGRWVYFRSDADGPGIYRKASDGSGAVERVTAIAGDASVHGFTPDGKTLVFALTSPSTARDLWMLDVEGDRTPRPLVVEPGDQSNAVVSPDGRWLAYHSAERGEIYVRPFPNVAGARWQLVAAGGKWPSWSRDGRELFYVNSKGMAAIAVDAAGATFQWSPERLLFEASYSGWSGLAGPRNYDLSTDGRRFLVIKEPSAPQSGSGIVVVENWFEELKRLATAKR